MITKLLAAAFALLLAGCVAAAPPPRQAALGYQCIAGVYQCRLPEQTAVGAPCSCPGIGAPSYGTVR